MNIQHFYGRRVGRPLKKLHKNLLRDLLPIYEINLPIDGSAELSCVMEGFDNYVLEIGFGTGDHLLEKAKKETSTGFIGCEPYISGVTQVLKSLQDHPLKNLRLSLEPIQLLADKLAPNSFHEIYILFPDPWPKKAHHKRRLITNEFLNTLSYLLKKDGRIVIATDHKEYALWMEEIFEKSSLLTMLDSYRLTRTFRPNSWPITRFENKAHREGRTCKIFELKKR